MTDTNTKPGPDGDQPGLPAGADQAPQGDVRHSLASVEAMQDTLRLFQQAMRRHAAGVCVISEGQGDDVNGMAVTAATSFSMDPPSVLVCVNQAASISPQLQEGVLFGLAVLGRQHEAVAATFSRKPSGRERFSHPAWQLQPCEPPWLMNAPANLLCVVERTMAYGSHTAVIGAVKSVRLGPGGPSLIYRDGTYG